MCLVGLCVWLKGRSWMKAVSQINNDKNIINSTCMEWTVKNLQPILISKNAFQHKQINFYKAPILYLNIISVVSFFCFLFFLQQCRYQQLTTNQQQSNISVFVSLERSHILWLI